MKAGITDGPAQGVKKQYFLTAEAILKYLLGTSDKIETMIMCKDADTELATTDYELYQAFGSVVNYDKLAHAKMAKLFENVDVFPHRKDRGEEKKILTHERADELQKLALKGE